MNAWRVVLMVLSLGTSWLVNADAPTPKATPTFVPDVDPNDEDFQKRMQVLMDQPDSDLSGGIVLPSGRIVYDNGEYKDPPKREEQKQGAGRKAP